MSPKRPSTWGRIASRSNEPAHIRASSPLLAEMQKWLDQNTTSRSVNPQSAITARCSRASASARKVFWMMLSGCGGGFGALGCIASVGGHRRVGAAVFRRLHRRRFSRHRPMRDAVERKVSPLRLGIRRRRRRTGLGRRRARFRGGLARLLDLELIGEHRLRQRRGRQQSGHFEQHAVGAAQFGFDEAARIGGRIDEIARRAAARAKSEAIERDQSGLRIAGHRISLCSCPLRAYIAARIIPPFGDEPDMKNTAKVRFDS